MLCPRCELLETRVLETRTADGGRVVRRRRECLGCHRRFTSYERVETLPLRVVKKDGSREDYDREKLLGGLLKACQKRPVATRDLERVADEVESLLQGAPDREVPTGEIGNLVMARLKDLDPVAYVRFASVYRQFRDIGEFLEEIKHLAEARRDGGG